MIGKKYTKEEIEHIKKALKDYEDIKTTFDTLIDNGNTIDKMLDIIVNYIKCDITNEEIGTNDYDYIDINYKDINISIVQEKNKKLHTTDYIEIWDDKECDFLGAYDYNQWKKIIEEVK